MFTIRTLSGGDYLYSGNQRVPGKASPHRWQGFGGHDRKFLVMHYTGGSSAQSSVDWFADPTSRVAAHVVIDRDGTVFHACRSTTGPGIAATAAGATVTVRCSPS